MEGRSNTATVDRQVDAEELEMLLGRLALSQERLDDPGRIDQIALLERLKGACAAAQARLTVDLDASQRQQLQAQGVESTAVGRSLAAQIALARRESPSRGSRHLGLAKAMVGEMPATYTALQEGLISEWAATLVVRATGCLSATDRTTVDARLAPRLGTLSDRRLEAAARAHAYELDPAAFVSRSRRAVAERRVTVRPAPDVMAYVTALVPMAEGVACYAALQKAARAVRAEGDDRTQQQIAADTLVERITGRHPADGVDLEIQLVMTDRTLLAGARTPARLADVGPIPAELARDLARTGTTRPVAERDHEVARAWVRRLFLSGKDGSVRARDPRRRFFDGPLRKLLVVRDQYCRTPWCGAPLRHLDHVQPSTADGPTDEDNGQGLCEACNYTKEAPGWSSRAVRLPDGSRAVATTTPTGHTYTSGAPPGLDSMTDLWDTDQDHASADARRPA